MILSILLLIPVSMVISWPLTRLMIRLGYRLRTFDTEAISGQQKMARRRIPNTGGVAITVAFILPVAVGLLGVFVFPELIIRVVPSSSELFNGVRAEAPSAAGLLACVGALHAVGLVDDRRPLGPWVKLAVMVLAGAACALVTGTRLLTLVDARVGGPWLSFLITVAWFVLITNAMNFMDNMDGLSAGCAAVASACFLVATILAGQWLIASMLALLIGALLGFLRYNFPPARIFMGDGGSLVIGFLLAFLTARTTFYDPARAGGWYALFMPFLVLAMPLYDFVTVTVVRLAQGKSPFVGDLNHFSHRLRRRGLSGRQVALVVYGITGATGIAGIVLTMADALGAALLGGQALLILCTLGLFEYAARTPATEVTP
ncbi:MAG: undecaprenyl/decaprenyl-phosphate alpha-N-acetylglucosaminyl 1-phosphate transferase [Phycisphaerales bacterium]|nr:undecaprenyl/decaprenyl-phosphate alpha-N-acetylglucosaminyl 1-phosphate transferase [Phycisphaerales bacterium]